MARLKLLMGAGLVAFAVPASADTLREALAKAYATNPTLTGARAGQRATDEGVPIARSAGRPSVNGTARYDEDFQQASGSSFSPDRQVSAGVNAAYPIYTGGAIRAGIDAAEARVLSGRAGLRSVEADLFTAVVAVYNDVIRDEAIVRLNQQNVDVLGVNLRAAGDRFEVGDVTRTDVAQSEARLAIARSQLQTAESTLIASREEYIRLVGDAPDTLEPPPELPNLPAEPIGAVQVALDNNPSLIQARRELDASGFDVTSARATRSPRVDVVVGGNYFNSLGSAGGGGASGVSIDNSGLAATGGVQLTVPLYQGGRPAAQVRQAQAIQSRAIEQVTGAERGVIAQARSQFANWRSSLDVIQSSEVAVSANRLSLEGVRAENSVGNRTILDILDAEREYLNSQVQLVSARRNAYVAGFALLAAMGRAEARDLGLDGGPLYDPLVNYDRVRNKASDRGGDPEPVPVATRTVDSPVQTPTVRQVIDPVLQPNIDRTPADPAGEPASNR